MQFRILRLGLLQDRDVRVGVFPEGEEVLVGLAAANIVADEGLSCPPLNVMKLCE